MFALCISDGSGYTESTRKMGWAQLEPWFFNIFATIRIIFLKWSTTKTRNPSFRYPDPSLNRRFLNFFLVKKNFSKNVLCIPEKCSTTEASLTAIVNLHWCFCPEFTYGTKRIIKMEFQRLMSWRGRRLKIGLLSISWISWLQLHIDHLKKNREVNKIENIL